MVQFSLLFSALVWILMCNKLSARADGRPETKIYYDVIDLVPDSVLDNKMKQSFRDIVEFSDKLFSRVDKPPQHPLPVNLALLRLYALQTGLARIPSQNGSAQQQHIEHLPAQMSEEFVAEALHYYKYAIAAYSAKPGITQQDIMLNNLDDKNTSNIKMPRHIVFLDHVTKSIVISIRGTASVSDMLTDLYMEAHPFLEPSRNLFAHHGMAESAETLLPLVTSAIHEIRQRTFSASAKPKSSAFSMLLNRKNSKRYKYGKYRVVVTGHSLGAGTASLLAILLSTQSNITATAFAFAPPPVVSYTDYLPPIGPSKWRLPFKFPFMKRSTLSSYQIHSFVHQNDIVSRCSHTQILSMISALSAVDQLPWGVLDRMGMLFRNVLSEEEKEAIHQALLHRTHFIEGNDHELYVPGDIYWLKPFVPTSDEEMAVGRNLSTTEEAHPGSTATHAPLSKGVNGNATAGSQSANASSGHAAVNASATANVTSVHTNVTANLTTSHATSLKSKEEVTFDLFGTTIVAPKLPEFPELPSFPELPPLPPQLLEALQHLLDPGSNRTFSSTLGIGTSTHVTSVTTPSAGSDKRRMDAYRAHNSAPSGNATDVTPAAAKSTTLSAYYRCVKVRDSGSLFNGLMYYGDGMVADHLTLPFENALLLLRSANGD